MPKKSPREQLLKQFTLALADLRALDVDVVWPQRRNDEQQRADASNWTDFLLDTWESIVHELNRWPNHFMEIDEWRELLQARFEQCRHDLRVWRMPKEPKAVRACMAKVARRFAQAEKIWRTMQPVDGGPP